MRLLKDKNDTSGKEVNLDEFIQFASSAEVMGITKKGVKGDLPMVCVSSNFDGKGIKQSNITEFTGFVGVDIDKKDNPNLTNMHNDLAKIKEYIVYASTTFSGGYRIILRVSESDIQKVNNNLKEYNNVVKSAYKIVETTGLVVDKNCKDITRRYFINYTEDVIINPNAKELPIEYTSTRESKAETTTEKKNTKKTAKKEKKETKHYLTIDPEKVRVSSNGVKYNHCIYLKVLPLNTFYLPKKVAVKLIGKEMLVDFIKIKEGGRNNALCRYLLNRVAYSVFNPKIPLKYSELLSYAHNFNNTYLDKPLPDEQVEATVRSIYNSFIQNKFTKQYLVDVFGVTYGGGYRKYSDDVRLKKLIYFIKKNGKNVTNAKAAKYLNISKRTLQYMLERYFDEKNLVNKLEKLVSIILGEIRTIVAELSKISEELARNFIEVSVFTFNRFREKYGEKDVGMVT